MARMANSRADADEPDRDVEVPSLEGEALCGAEVCERRVRHVDRLRLAGVRSLFLDEPRPRSETRRMGSEDLSSSVVAHAAPSVLPKCLE